jgi:hypothetical protein
MATTLDDLAEKVVKPESKTGETSARTDRGIQGTYVDDDFAWILIRTLVLVAVLVLWSIGYLALERLIGVKVLTMIRIWSPVVAWGLMAFFEKPFFKIRPWAALATLTMIPALSGHLWQLFQGMVGAR